jgi:PAS domain S-box-containing protein
MPSSPVQVKDSIAAQLLKSVFLLYLVVAVGTTIVHMVAEYNSTKQEVEHELQVIGDTFAPGLARALWDMNPEQLQPTFLGMVKSPKVVGVRLKDEQGAVVGASGVVTTTGGAVVLVKRDGTRVPHERPMGLFHHTVPIYHARGSTRHQVGEATLYSSTGVVVDELKLGFALIVINSIIKTFALWFLVLWISRRVLSRPLAALTAATRQVTLEGIKDDLHVDLKTRGRNELKVLEEAFNAMIATLRDSRLEQQQSRLLLQEIVDKSPAVIFLKDPQLRYLLINTQYESLFHVSREEILGRTDHDVFPKDTADTFRDNDLKVIEAHGPLNIEEQVPQDDGVHTYLSVKFPLLDAEGEISAVCGIATDISESKRAAKLLKDYNKRLEEEVAQRTADLQAANEQLQTEVQERERAEHAMQEAKEAADLANRAKSDFLASMSHEIRTPMNAVLGLNSLALQAETSPKVHDYLTKMRSSSRTLLGLIDDILDFSRIEARKLELSSASFDLHDLLSSLPTMLGEEAANKGVELRLAIGQDLPRVVLGDALRLGQVLTNLVSNAVKFTHQGQVVIGAELVSGDEHRYSISFSVRDTGIGIDPARVEHLAEPFYQGDSSMARKYGGTGLGLAITWRLVRMMGGEIEVQSEPNRGSTFSCVLDLRRPTEADLQPPAAGEAGAEATTPDLSGLRVLVAEDVEINREIICAMLEGAGLRVAVVVNGSEAVQAVSEAAFDVVLMDVRMPEMDGYEATRRIRADPRHADLPIIAVTAHALKGERERCLEAGMSDHVTKPIDLEHLLSVMARGVASADRPAQGEGKSAGEECG